MRVLLVGVLCVLAGAAEAAQWRCQSLGYKPVCEAGEECGIDDNRAIFDVNDANEATLREDMKLADDDKIRFTQLPDRRPATAVYLVWRDDGAFEYGHCWAKQATKSGR